MSAADDDPDGFVYGPFDQLRHDLKSPLTTIHGHAQLLARAIRRSPSLPEDEQARMLALTGGDDYELCFTVPPRALEALQRDLPASDWGYRRIGVLREQMGSVVTRDGIVMRFSHSGFDHFASGD